MKHVALLLSLIFFFSGVGAVAGAELSGDQLPKSYKRAFKAAKNSKVFEKIGYDDIWFEGEHYSPKNSNEVYNIFEKKYWSLDKIVLIDDIEEFIRTRKVTSEESKRLLRLSAGFLYNGKVYLVQTHQFYVNLVEAEQKYKANIEPVLTAIIIHEIGHALLDKHQDAYQLGIDYLEPQVRLAQVKWEKGVRGYNQVTLALLQMYLKDMERKKELYTEE